MSPFSSEPHNGFPFMGDMQQFGLSQMAFMGGPQHEQPSVDNTPGGQHSMDATQFGPPFMDPTQPALTMQSIHERMHQVANGCKLISSSPFLHTTIP